MSLELKKWAGWRGLRHYVFNARQIASICLLLFANSYASGQNADQKNLQRLDQQATKGLEKLAPKLRERLEKQVETEEQEKQVNNPLNFFPHVRSLCLLLSDYGYNRQTAKAEATYKKILDLMKANHSPDDRSKANLMLYLGQACSDWGKPEYSEAAYRKGLAMVQIYEGDKKDKELQALFLSSLGEACLEERKFDEAQHYFQQVYDYRHNFVGEPIFVVGARLAEIYRYKKNYTESERLFKEALANFPQDNYAQKHYAQLLLDMGQTNEAQDINKQIVAEAQENSAESTKWKMILLKMAENMPTKSQQDAENKEFAETHAPLIFRAPSYCPPSTSTHPVRQYVPIQANTSNMPPWYLPYNAEFQRQIRRTWFPPAITTPTQGIIIFNISRNGVLGLWQLVKRSGNIKFDDSCISSIKNARFRTLPSEAPDNMRFQITFLSEGHGNCRLDLVWIH